MPKMQGNFVNWGRFIILGLGAFVATRAMGYPTLNQAYSTLGFDPNVPSNSVVVVFSDPHLCLDLTSGTSPVATTNLLPGLVNAINSMQPPPAKIVVSGDVASTYSVVPGWIPGGDWYLSYGTNEMKLWWPAIAAFTNVAPDNIVWCPGNHDQDPRENNADMLVQILGRPPHAAFSLNGIRFLLMNGGNYATPPQEEKAWLLQELAQLAPTQSVAVVVHQPPFNNCDRERGIGLFLKSCFKDWQARWFVLCGHNHGQEIRVLNIGYSNVVMMTSGTVNTNVFSGLTHGAGFRFLCLSNGFVGSIYYHLHAQDYELEAAPNWGQPDKYVTAFEETPGLLWRRLKTTRGNPPEVLTAKRGTDSVEWYAYSYDIIWRLNLNWHSNQATHFLLLGSGFHPISKIEYSLDQTNWNYNTSFPAATNSVYSFPLPPEYLTNQIVYVRFTSDWASGNNFIGGWGLAGSHPTPDISYPRLQPVPTQSILAGRTLTFTNVAPDPYSPPEKMGFSLLSGPVGSTINPTNGIFSWQPPLASAPQTVTATVKVADLSTPTMSATQQVQITVHSPAVPQLTIAPNANGGYGLQINGDGGIDYTIWSSTNLLDWWPIRITNPPTTPFGLPLPVGEHARQFYRVTLGP
jgi:predicted phosphodiesterase